MSSFGTGLAGLVGTVVFLMGMLSFCQKRWIVGCAWLISGVVLIGLLTFLDKPGSHPSEPAAVRSTGG
jgi:hypothetical protein